MRRLTKILAVAAIAGAAALPLQSANAWNGPWGSNMFGMDFGQSTGGYGPYGGNGPWGMNMFGMDFGQNTAYGRPYYGAPYAYAPVAPQVVPQTQVETK